MIFMKAGMVLSALLNLQVNNYLKQSLTLKCKVAGDLSGQTCRVRHKSTPGCTTLNKD